MQHTRAACHEGINRARKALSRKGWTQAYLATQVVVDDDHRLNDLPVSTSTVKRFFQGRRIRAALFGGICTALDLDPDQVELGQQVLIAPLPTGIWGVPYNRNHFLVGRDQVLQQIRTALTQQTKPGNPAYQVVSGLGGMGKTQVAIEYAYRHEPDYQAIFWVNAQTETDRLAGFFAIAQQLQLSINAEAPPHRVISSVFQGLSILSDWLLVFDGADDPAQLKPFHIHRGRGHILITSRAQRFDYLGIARPVRLDPLSPEDAVAFLLQRSGYDAIDSAEQSAAAALATAVGYLPLALEQAAAYILDRQIQFQDYLTSYQRFRLEVLQRSRPLVGDYQESVATTWLMNFQQIETKSPIAVDLLRLSAFMADAIPYEALERGYEVLSGLLKDKLEIAMHDPSCVPDILAPLSRFSLVTIDPEDRTYSLHRLVQETMREQAMDEDTCRDWAAQAIEMLGTVFPDIEFAQWPQCDRLLPHALTCCQQWIGQYEYRSPKAARLLNQTGHYLTRKGRYAEAEPLLLAAVAMRQAVLGDNTLETAASIYNLAALYRIQGRFDEAETHHRKVLTIRQLLLPNDHADIATSLDDLALLHHYQGRLGEAEILQREAIAMRTRLFGDAHEDLASSLNNLGLLYLDQEREQEAVQLFERVYQIYQEQLGELHPYTATALNNVALAYQAQGHFEEAASSFQTVLENDLILFGARHPAVATTISNISRLKKAQGQYAAAQQLCEQALELRQQALGEEHPDIAASRHDRAELMALQGHYQPAVSLLREVLAWRDLTLGSDHPSTTKTKNLLAKIHQEHLGSDTNLGD